MSRNGICTLDQLLYCEPGVRDPGSAAGACSPAEEKKTVAVIGGGPVGMYAALTAAERGHTVTVFEKEDIVGGQLNHSLYFPFKWTLSSYRTWLIRQCEKAGVIFRTGVVPSPGAVAAGEYDAVLAAVGAEHILPNIRVIVLGASETGTEIAMYLAGCGHEVTLLTRQTRIAHDAPILHHLTMDHVGYDTDGFIHTFASWENYPSLKTICEANTVSITPTSVVYQDRNGNEMTLEADQVLVNGGTKPRIEEAMQYAACADEFALIGDCNGKRSMLFGIRDAYAKATQI